jgi:hypothetical protein
MILIVKTNILAAAPLSQTYLYFLIFLLSFLVKILTANSYSKQVAIYLIFVIFRLRHKGVNV